MDKFQPTAATDRVLAEHTDAIRALRSRVVRDVAEIGRHLAEGKSIVGHGNFGPWLDREFGWTDKTAENFMRVYAFVESVSNSKSVSNLILSFPVSSVYLFAAPSTPEAAREEIVKRAQAGERVLVADVKRVIETAKGRKQPARKTSEKKRRRTPEEICTERFKHGIEYVLICSIAQSASSVLSCCGTSIQVRLGERALCALANRIKQVRSGPTPSTTADETGAIDSSPNWRSSAMPPASSPS